MKHIALVISSNAEATSYASKFVRAAAAVGLSAVPLEDADEVEAVVAVGGDGTVLQAAHAAVARDVPVMG
ncbi:MAG: NAD(+)/NADH kinase, partial [Acidimicrobiia bacterium]|nr:NAD(+)/NADH kinase [Acidimicrobiia bacterium]